MPFSEPTDPIRPVRAKMYVSGLDFTTWGTTVKLQAVTRGEDNKQWAAATPSGTLTLQIKNQGAADQFAPGQEWFIDMVPIPAEQKDQEGMG